MCAEVLLYECLFLNVRGRVCACVYKMLTTNFNKYFINMIFILIARAHKIFKYILYNAIAAFECKIEQSHTLIHTHAYLNQTN